MNLDQTFSALADPTRLAILARLQEGEATPGELSKPFDISGPAISRHLKVLERAGLIVRRVDAQRRPCRLNPQAFQEVDRWLERYRSILEANYDRLDALLERQTEGEDS